jgi:hypothetical protein
MTTTRARILLLLVLGLATASHADTVSCPHGWLIGPAPQAAAAIGPNQIAARAVPSLVVQAESPSGTATVQLETCCSPLDCAPAAAWAPVGAPMALTATTPSQIVTVAAPTCMYRARVTACAECRVNVVVACSGS